MISSRRRLDLDKGELGLGLVELPDVERLVVLHTLVHLVRPETLGSAPTENQSTIVSEY